MLEEITRIDFPVPPQGFNTVLNKHIKFILYYILDNRVTKFEFVKIANCTKKTGGSNILYKEEYMKHMNTLIAKISFIIINV